MTQAERIIKRFGTQENLAKALGCRQGTIAGWKKRGYVPVRQQGRVLVAARNLNIDLKPDDFFADQQPGESPEPCTPTPTPAQ